MKSLEERLQSVKDDPKKLKRLFTFTWVAAYSMLLIGFMIIIYVFLFT